MSVTTLLKISRPGLWLVFVWLYLWPTGGRTDLLSSPIFWLGVIYCTFPLNLLVYGMNDLVDEDVDQDNPRKGNFIYGAKTTRKDRRRLPLALFLINSVCLIPISWMTGKWLETLIWFGSAFAVNFAYNNKPFQLSRKCPFEVPTMILGHFLIPILACYINELEYPRAASWVFNGLLLARSHIWLEFADIAVDVKEGKRTLAVVVGPKWAFRTVISLTLLESLVGYVYLESAVLGLFSLFGVVVFSMNATDKGVKEEKVHVSISQSLVGVVLMCYLWINRVFL